MKPIEESDGAALAERVGAHNERLGRITRALAGLGVECPDESPLDPTALDGGALEARAARLGALGERAVRDARSRSDLGEQIEIDWFGEKLYEEAEEVIAFVAIVGPMGPATEHATER